LPQAGKCLYQMRILGGTDAAYDQLTSRHPKSTSHGGKERCCPHTLQVRLHAWMRHAAASVPLSCKTMLIAQQHTCSARPLAKQTTPRPTL
jgi:hypothetical protein